MADWGPISAVQDLGTVGAAAGTAHFTDLHWELYRVTHATHAALWEIASDRKGAVWALKAQALETPERASTALLPCLSADIATGG